jgi:hypothetical protein
MNAMQTTRPVLAKRARPPAALFEPGWIPEGYAGPIALPGTGRMVWWTGRVAIGLRYVPTTSTRREIVVQWEAGGGEPTSAS